MKIVEVIPIVKGITKPSLSYFTKDNFDLGSFVKIPIRNGSTLGIVESVRDAKSMKSGLKGSSFALKKLKTIGDTAKLSHAFMQACEETAIFYATTTGNILSAVLPKFFLEHPNLLNKSFDFAKVKTKEVRLVQLSNDERFREYRGIVRENFARGSSVMLVAPSGEDVKRLSSTLRVGIENYVYNVVGTTAKSMKTIEKGCQ